jgi:tetratricopeptide (TPR) repeat protein
MPESLRALAVARLDALPADLKALVHDASVVGRVFWPGAVAAVGETEPDDIEARLPFLLRRRLIERRDPSSVEGEAELAFRHDITMRVAYEQIPRAARARKHRNAAAWVRRIAGGRVAEVAEEIAHHLERALALSSAPDGGLRAETADAQLLVGSHLDALDAPGAVRAYERALELIAVDDPRRASVLVRAGAAAEAVGRFGAADSRYREAIEEFEASGDRRQLGETLGALGRSLMMQGRVEEADAAFLGAVAILDELPPGPELARVCARLAGRSFVAGDYDAAMSWATRTLEVAERGEPRDAVSMALQYRGSVRAERGEPEGLDDLRAAIRISRDAELTDVLGIALGNLAYLTWFRDGPAAALEIAQEIESFGAARGFAVLEMWGKAAELESCFDLGEWERVLTLADEMLRWDARHGPSQIGAFARFGAAWVLIRRGRTDEAAAQLEAVASEPAFSGLAEFRATIATMGAVLAEDDTVLAAHLEDFRAATQDLPEVRLHLLPVVVRAAVGRGRPDLGTALVPADPGAPVERRRLSHATALAVLAEAGGENAEAAESYGELAAGWDAFGFPLEVGNCLLGRGRCLHALGRDAEAAAALADARARFVALDATPSIRATDEVLASLTYAADSIAAS